MVNLTVSLLCMSCAVLWMATLMTKTGLDGTRQEERIRAREFRGLVLCVCVKGRCLAQASCQCSFRCGTVWLVWTVPSSSLADCNCHSYPPLLMTMLTGPPAGVGNASRSRTTRNTHAIAFDPTWTTADQQLAGQRRQTLGPKSTR